MKLWASLIAALLAWYIGKALGIPAWNSGHTFEAWGDRSDIAVVAGCFVYSVLTVVQQAARRND